MAVLFSGVEESLGNAWKRGYKLITPFYANYPVVNYRRLELSREYSRYTGMLFYLTGDIEMFARSQQIVIRNIEEGTGGFNGKVLYWINNVAIIHWFYIAIV